MQGIEYILLSVTCILPQMNCLITNKQYLFDDDMQKFTEKLLKMDNSNLYENVSVNKQGRYYSFKPNHDAAPDRLLTVYNKINNHPTVKTLIELYGDYDPEISKEVFTEDRRNAFLKAIFATKLFKYTYSFFSDKGLYRKSISDFKKWLEALWFTTFNRTKNKKSTSSAFAHVFLGELTHTTVSGLHNWIYFSYQEKSKKLNYLGWIKEVDFGKGKVLKLGFEWRGVRKPVGSLFIGTSPELELSLYCLCYLARPNRQCRIKLNGHDISILIHTFTDQRRNMVLIKSAYPETP